MNDTHAGVDAELRGFHAACAGRAQRQYAGCVHDSLSLAGQTGAVRHHTPAAPARRAGAGPRSRRQHRPGPAPRPRVADACAALAGLGFGVSVGTVVIGETRGALPAPGGLLPPQGRPAAVTGADRMALMAGALRRLPRPA